MSKPTKQEIEEVQAIAEKFGFTLLKPSVEGHLHWPVVCTVCNWTGVNGELIASAHKPKPCCPQCGSMEINYPMGGNA
jgi:rRNA maturation endonuclease Nob1